MLVHVVLECFASVDEDDGNFVGVSSADFRIGVYINFAPSEGAVLFEFDEAFLDDLTEVTSLAGVDDDFARTRHTKCESSSFRGLFPR